MCGLRGPSCFHPMALPSLRVLETSVQPEWEGDEGERMCASQKKSFVAEGKVTLSRDETCEPDAKQRHPLHCRGRSSALPRKTCGTVGGCSLGEGCKGTEWR